MALVDNSWYVNFGDGSTTGYYAVTAWVALTTYDCGALRRQAAAPAVGSERVFVVVAGHVASGAAEPTWVLTRGAKTTDATITWMEATGIAALNGDLSTATPNWTTVKNTAITQGQVIQNNAGTLILICTTAGTAGNGAEPSWAAYTTAGATTADNTATWTTLGSSFGAWAAPHARLANSFTATWGQAGNTFYVGGNHAETQATAITLTAPGTTASPNKVLCVNQAGSVPPVSADLVATATISTTGTNAINFASAFAYFRGIAFQCGNSTSNAALSILNTIANSLIVFDLCSLVLGGTGSTSIIIGASGTASQNVLLNNTTMTFGATSQGIVISNARFTWKNTASALGGAIFPTTLFSTTASRANIIMLIGVDLSALGSGKTIIGASSPSQNISLTDCKLGASVTVATTPTAAGGPETTVVSSDSGATNYRAEKYSYFGTQTTETTIVRTGGASDGTTTISQKFVATANSKWQTPFESIPITIWNDSTSAITTLTIYGTTTGGGVPNNDDIWVEVEYLGSSATPQASVILTTKADILAASVTTNNSADGSTWGGGGAGNGFKMVVPSFTPGMKGPINITIKVAKASATYYIDPRPAISGITVNKSEIIGPGVYINELSSGSGGGGMRLAGRGGLASGA